MKTVSALVKRNVALFFSDKGIFFTSLITPAILLVLYASFLANVFSDSLVSSLPAEITLSDKVVNGYVAAQVISSILSVSAITVAFCSNMIMVQDKANKTITDLTVSPVNPFHLSISYYIATLISTLTVCMSALILCLIYARVSGWFLSALDILCLVIDVVLLVLFGTALSSVINFFLKSQGQISAVGTIVSSGYGFICGAYMPISQFSKELQRAVFFFPGTYGTSLLKNHAMRGVFKAMESEGLPTEAIDSIKTVVDCKIKFFDNEVSVPAMFAVLIISITVLVSAYVIMNFMKYRRHLSK